MSNSGAVLDGQTVSIIIWLRLLQGSKYSGTESLLSAETVCRGYMVVEGRVSFLFTELKSNTQEVSWNLFCPAV